MPAPAPPSGGILPTFTTSLSKNASFLDLHPSPLISPVHVPLAFEPRFIHMLELGTSPPTSPLSPLPLSPPTPHLDSSRAQRRRRSSTSAATRRRPMPHQCSKADEPPPPLPRLPKQFRPLPSQVKRDVDLFFGALGRPTVESQTGMRTVLKGGNPAGRKWMDAEEEEEFTWLLSNCVKDESYSAVIDATSPTVLSPTLPYLRASPDQPKKVRPRPPPLDLSIQPRHCPPLPLAIAVETPPPSWSTLSTPDSLVTNTSSPSIRTASKISVARLFQSKAVRAVLKPLKIGQQ